MRLRSLHVELVGFVRSTGRIGIIKTIIVGNNETDVARTRTSKGCRKGLLRWLGWLPSLASLHGKYLNIAHQLVGSTSKGDSPVA